MKPKRASKPRRLAMFVLAVLMLCGLNTLDAVLSRHVPLWFNLGWLGLFGWMCWNGWEDD
jgi:hypothetical protein